MKRDLFSLALAVLLTACGGGGEVPLSTAAKAEPKLEWIAHGESVPRAPGTAGTPDAIASPVLAAEPAAIHALPEARPGPYATGPAATGPDAISPDAIGLGALGGLGALDAADAIDARLEADLDALVDRWYVHAREASGGKLAAADTKISIHVRDLATGATLADVRGSRLMRPASNLKLITSAAALVLMGPGGEHVTRLYLDPGAISHGALDGDLVVMAGGDPLVEDGSGGAVEHRLDVFADVLAARGVRSVSGDLVLDEGDFLEPGPGPSWPSSNQHWEDYCALAAGLTINAGVLEARVTAGAIGERARIALHPSPTGLPAKLGVSTVSGSLNDVRVGATTRRVTVGGSIGTRTGSVETAFRHPDPVGLFGAVLRERLARAGIEVEGDVLRRRGARADLEVVGELRSPITAGLVPINTHSNNGVADQQFFTLGHLFGGGGTRAGGQAAVASALERLGLDATGLVQVDGSGLSRDNRVTPEQFTGLLVAVLAGLDEGDPTARRYLDSLAVAGRTGTLDSRMRGGPAEGRAFAKTGFLSGTSGLSGLVETRDGRRLVFSILVNYPSLGGLNSSSWKPMQDAMVERLVTGN